MVAKLGRLAGVTAAVLLLATSAVAQNRVNGPDQEIVITLHRLNHEEMTMARMGQAEGRDPKVKQLASSILKDHEAADRRFVAYAERKNMNMASVLQAPEARAYGVLAMADLTNSRRGAEFDYRFATKVVSEHQGMIAAAQEAQRLARDPELRQLVASSLPMLWEHLSMAEALVAQLPEPPPRVVHLPGEPSGVSRTQTGADEPPAAATTIIGP